MTWYNTGGGGGGGSSIDYTALITAIKNSVAGIDADTNALAPILLAVDTLEAIGTTGNATSAQILTAVSSILTQAQAINANTDQLESLLTAFAATFQAESDQTQIGLAEIKAAIEAMPLDVEFLQVVDYVAGVSCTSFMRKIVGGVATDYAEDGITPYVVQGVVKAECPALFLNGSETAEKSFVGYKSLEIVVLDGSVSISDGTNTTTYPQVGASQTVGGVRYDGGVLLSNTITVTPTVIGTTYAWSGVL
jgi:hypothetical protein